MDIRIIHFYPDLMNLYGSYANVSVLQRYLQDLGNTVVLETVAPGENCDLTGADFLDMGAGTERRQKAALADFARFGEAVKTACADGVAMLFAGTAMELLGSTITDDAGTVYQGIGLGDFTCVQGKKRIVEDVYAATELCPEAVVGFMNKCTIVSGVETPLLSSLSLGFGNEERGGAEGFRRNKLIASHLTGPLLVKNPRLLEWVAEAIYHRRGEDFPKERPTDSWAEKGYAITAAQLKLRSDTRAYLKTKKH